MVRKPWGTGSVNGDVTRKSCIFTKMSILLILNTWKECTEFYEFDDMQIYNFLMFLDITLLNCNQNTLGYCFSESWCCQKIRPFFYLKCQVA